MLQAFKCCFISCCIQDTSIVPETIEKQPPKLLEIPSSPVERLVVPEPQEAEHQLSVDEMILIDDGKKDAQEVAEDSILPEKKPKVELPAPRDEVWTLSFSSPMSLSRA